MIAAATAANIVVALCGLFSILWIVCLVVPSGWHVSTVLFTMRFETCLYQVHIEKNPMNAEIEQLIQKKYSRLEVLKEFAQEMTSGTFGLQEIQSRICGVGPSSYCDQWSRLVFCSWAMMFCGICIVIFYWLAAGFLAYFWNANPTTFSLKCSRTCLILTPCFAFIGLALYFAMTLEFGDSEDKDGKETPVDYGAAFFLCVTMVVSSAIPIAIFEMFGINQEGENEAYEARLKRYSLDDPSMQLQMRCSLPPPMYGTAPSTDGRGCAPALPTTLPPPSPYLGQKSTM